LRKPRRLPQGGTIGVVGPASTPFRLSDLLWGKASWGARGFRGRIDGQTFQRDWSLAGNPPSRAAAPTVLFEEPSVAALQAGCGGFGATQIIPHLDFDRIARQAKPFVGRSDITAIHLALFHRAGLVTFYGPGMANLSPPAGSAFAEAGLQRALTVPQAL